MKFNKDSLKTIIILDCVIIIIFVIVIPNLLNLVGLDLKIQVLSNLANYLILTTIIITALDLIFLTLKKENYFYLASFNMSLSISVFLLLEYCFVNDYYNFLYVWSYSKSTLPFIYKLVAIWAGEAGSIMTWMVFNSIVIFFYRIKNQNKEDIVFIRSVIILLIISIFFLIILFYLNPFEFSLAPVSDGSGLNPLLISPFMIWHPLFTFIAYAIFLIPFTITIAEMVSKDSKLLNSYQTNFYDFSLKFGWLVLTLSIGLGAYWAKIALLPWGRYWGWDPVETVSLIPWFFITAFFHTRLFKKKNPNLIKINVTLIFFAIIFSTLITRGGGLTSLHAFTGKAGLVIWVLIVGLILISLSLYTIYIILDYILEEYRKINLLFDYLSYLFLFALSIVCIIGLLVPPFTNLLSTFLPIDTVTIGVDYFIIGTSILAIGLALTLTFCSLREFFKIKLIFLLILIIVAIQSALSLVLGFLLDLWINPLIMIYFIALFSSLFKLVKNINFKRGIKQFFRINSKTIIHAGLSFILIGTSVDPSIWVFQDIFFITGFIFLLSGIIPSTFILFFIKKMKS
ncbi:MAG: cytochrome c biogenesis protein CcsA [Promethearchaeota archaeon]